MSPDFVTGVPRSALSEEEEFHSSVEVAAAKWNEGYAPVDRVREAIRYCLARTVAKGNRFDYAFESWPFYCDVGTPEWEFRLKNSGVSRGRSRREVTKAFLCPLPVADEVLVVTSVIEWLSPDLGRGPLPPYSEFPGADCLGTVLVSCG
jgi:hypothetical protein